MPRSVRPSTKPQDDHSDFGHQQQRWREWGEGETGSGYFEREASTLTNATEKPCEMKTKKKGTIGSGHVETLTRAPVMGAED